VETTQKTRTQLCHWLGFLCSIMMRTAALTETAAPSARLLRLENSSSGEYCCCCCSACWLLVTIGKRSTAESPVLGFCYWDGSSFAVSWELGRLQQPPRRWKTIATDQTVDAVAGDASTSKKHHTQRTRILNEANKIAIARVPARRRPLSLSFPHPGTFSAFQNFDGLSERNATQQQRRENLVQLLLAIV